MFGDYLVVMAGGLKLLTCFDWDWGYLGRPSLQKFDKKISGCALGFKYFAGRFAVDPFISRDGSTLVV
jgi:hypothetical protein